MCVDIWVPPPVLGAAKTVVRAPTNPIPGPPLFLMLPPPPHKDDAPYFLNVTYSPLHQTHSKIPFVYSFSWIARGLSPNFHIHVSVSD
jgi:hypothetical protein